MKIAISAALFLLSLLLASNAAVVRPAPDFTWPGVGQTRPLKSFRGQAVVLLIAESPRTGPFRKEVRWLEQTYKSLASRGVIFVAAFRHGEGPVKSNIPFVIANNGGAVAQAYGTQKDFTLVVIGRDGNIDYQTDRVCTGERVRDVVQNAFPVQSGARKSQ